jgi:hypothetical protein
MMPVGRGEVVNVGTGFAGQIPIQFTWRGRKHRIRSIELSSPGSRVGRRRHSGREIYRVQTVNGLRCRLSRGKLRGDWRMESVLAGGR